MDERPDRDWPECERCIYQTNCPCHYSCCNAACLTIFKEIERSNKDKNGE